MATAYAGGELLLRSPEANWDRERWEQLPDDGNRYEIIDGVLYMSTAPSPRHQWIIRQIVRQLFRQVDDTGVGETLWAPIGLFMPGCDPVQPDILVVLAAERGIIGERRVEGIPALLVEVLSPSNPDQDLITKRRAYARAGVPEYWVVRSRERDLLIHSQPEREIGQYLQVDHARADGDLVSPTLPIRAPVAALFAGFPADED
jgi:Uma2 family endonuclease